MCDRLSSGKACHDVRGVMTHQVAGSKYIDHWPIWVPEIPTVIIPWVKAYLNMRMFYSNHILISHLNHLK